MNICGCLIHVAPRYQAQAIEKVKATAGVEIHATSEDGRLVVVVEDTPDKLASETIMDLHQIAGVVSLTLTYHHFEGHSSAAPGANSQLGDQNNDRIGQP